MEPKDVLQKLTALYQKLMTKDLTPDEEAEAKVQLLEILSSIKAHAEIQGGDTARNIMAQTNYLKEMLLEWDPFGSAWFKEEKTLVDSIYNLLAAVKTLTIQKVVASEGMGVSDLRKRIDEVSASMQSEIETLKTEVATIKKSVIALATAMKEKFDNQKNFQQAPKPGSNASSQMPAPLAAAPISMPKPVPIPGKEQGRFVPKPISLPKPVPIPIDEKGPESHPQPFRSSSQKPIPIPKPEPGKEASPKPEPIEESAPTPQPIPLDEPEPIPLSGPDFEEPSLLDDSGGESKADVPLFGSLSSGTKEAQKKPDKEQLFNLFSSGPTRPSSGVEQLELIEDPSELGAQRSASPVQLMTQGTTSSTGPQTDPETLYQELISLEGKRYSIERSIRDLKTDRESGVISDHEYKEKISQLLNKLQSISKRIGEIREKLD